MSSRAGTRSRRSCSARARAVWRQAIPAGRIDTVSPSGKRGTILAVDPAPRRGPRGAPRRGARARAGRARSLTPADALDRGAAGGELVLQPLEAAVEVIDAVDHGLALGGERGDDERHRGAQIGRHHRRALEPLDALDGRGLAVELDSARRAAPAPARA